MRLNITTRSSTDEVVATTEVPLERLVPKFIDLAGLPSEDGFGNPAVTVTFTLKDGASACTGSDRLVILDNVDLQYIPTPVIT